MRVVGKRKVREIQARPTGALLAEGARINEGFGRVADSGSTFIPKGVYRFGTAEAAEAHRERCLAEGMARIALKRR